MEEQAVNQLNSEIDRLRKKAKKYEAKGQTGAADECYRKIRQKQNTMANL